MNNQGRTVLSTKERINLGIAQFAELVEKHELLYHKEPRGVSYAGLLSLVDSDRADLVTTLLAVANLCSTRLLPDMHRAAALYGTATKAGGRLSRVSGRVNWTACYDAARAADLLFIATGIAVLRSGEGEE